MSKSSLKSTYDQVMTSNTTFINYVFAVKMKQNYLKAPNPTLIDFNSQN